MAKLFFFILVFGSFLFNAEEIAAATNKYSENQYLFQFFRTIQESNYQPQIQQQLQITQDLNLGSPSLGNTSIQQVQFNQISQQSSIIFFSKIYLIIFAGLLGAALSGFLFYFLLQEKKLQNLGKSFHLS